jgi:hypothetical protein
VARAAVTTSTRTHSSLRQSRETDEVFVCMMNPAKR